MQFWIIENIIRSILCLGALGICVAALVVVCKNSKQWQIDTQWLNEHKKIVVGQVVLIILLWSISWFVMTFNMESILHVLDMDSNDWLEKVIAFMPELLVIWFLIRIDIYPSLAFRAVPQKHKKQKKKRSKIVSKQYIQLYAQFWNGGLFQLYKIQPSLLGYRRDENGNLITVIIPLHKADGTEYIKGLLYSQDERAYTWSSDENFLEPYNKRHAFEYYELTISTQCNLMINDYPYSTTCVFYPEDVHQGEFKKISSNKVPQELYTLYNNKEYISAKRIIQKYNICLRDIQLSLLALCFICFCCSFLLPLGYALLTLEILQKTSIAIICIFQIWRILLKIPIRTLQTPSYIYGTQKSSMI